MKRRRPAFVGLLWAGVGTAVADSGGELGDELLDELCLLSTQVGLFAGIVGQIEELHMCSSSIWPTIPANKPT